MNRECLAVGLLVKGGSIMITLVDVSGVCPERVEEFKELKRQLAAREAECERLRTIFRELSEYYHESPFKTQQYLQAAAGGEGK
jgi:hypothetical protein